MGFNFYFLILDVVYMQYIDVVDVCESIGKYI